MESTLETQIKNAAVNSIGKAISETLTGYNSPLEKLCHNVVNDHHDELYKILKEEFGKTLKSPDFKNAVKMAFDHKLAKILVSKLEGSVEKAVTTLRSDPTLRAKMILAIEGVIENYNH